MKRPTMPSQAPAPVAVPLRAYLASLLVLLARMPGPVLALAQGAQSLAMLLPAIANLQRFEADLQTDGGRRL